MKKKNRTNRLVVVVDTTAINLAPVPAGGEFFQPTYTNAPVRYIGTGWTLETEQLSKKLTAQAFRFTFTTGDGLKATGKFFVNGDTGRSRAEIASLQARGFDGINTVNNAIRHVVRCWGVKSYESFCEEYNLRKKQSSPLPDAVKDFSELQTAQEQNVVLTNQVAAQPDGGVVAPTPKDRKPVERVCYRKDHWITSGCWVTIPNKTRKDGSPYKYKKVNATKTKYWRESRVCHRHVVLH